MAANTIMRAALIVALTMQAAASQPSMPDQVWSVTIDGTDPIVASAWSPNDACLAVATRTSVQTIDRAGRPLWKWDFSRTTRLLHPDALGRMPLAVSPHCDAVAIGGATDYRYVWIADRQGRHAAFKTSGTIHAVRYDVRGEVVAVSTGASHGYLITRTLRLGWTGPLNALPITWSGEQADPANPVPTEFLREDVDALFAAPPWGLGIRDSVSDDGQWRAIETAPYRGPGTAFVKFWGPHAGSFRHRADAYGTSPEPRWSIAIGCPAIAVSRDGQFVVVTGDPDHPDSNEFGDPQCNDELTTLVYDRAGKVVVKSPAKTDPQQLADAVLAASGRHLSVRTDSRWARPFMEFVDVLASELPRRPRTMEYSHDATRLLATREQEIRMYLKPSSH